MTKKLLGLSILFSFLGLTLITPASAETTPPPKPAKPTIDLVCMQNAVAKRDNAMITSLDTYQAALKASLSKRRDGLVNAWKIEDKKDRTLAIKNIWVTFGKERIAERYDYYKARVASWTTYRADRKACGSKAAAEDMHTPAIVNE